MHIHLLLIFAFVAIITSKKYTCVFDQLYKDYHPHQKRFQNHDQPMTYNHHGRQLVVLSRTPIRITLDTSDFNTIKPAQGTASLTTSAHLQYIKRAMEVAQAFFQNRLQVTQLSRVKAPPTCFDFNTSINDQTNGVASSDLHIYVQYITASNISYGATGVSCKVFSDPTVPRQTFQEGRPTVGRIKFNTYTLLEDQGISNDQALLTNRRFAAITATAIHQTTHILGFDSSLYGTYLDPSTTNGSIYDYNTIISTAAKLHPNRPESQLIRTPFVTAWAKDFFGCPAITGMQVQNQDATTPGSHWERVIMYDQLMTGSQLGAQKGISGATFALLKDMGWYDVDDRFSESTNFGYKKGCSFFTDACWVTPSLPQYFCDAPSMTTIESCLSNFQGKAMCTNQASLMADTCSMWGGGSGGINCVDAQDIDSRYKQYTLEQYRTDSFCVTSTFGTSTISSGVKARCYPYVCTYAPDVESIKFTVGTNIIPCLKTEFGVKKVTSAMTGYLECPVYDDFCVNSKKICKNWCSKNGICTRGICNCYPGFSGEDCSKTICISTQYFNPSDNTCGASCPSGTYQNKYSKTCLPCASSCAQCTNQPQLCSSCHSTVANPKVSYNGVCSDSCPLTPIPTYQIGDYCFNCDTVTAHCETCTGTATTCTSCPVGYILDNPVSGVCGTTCSNPSYSTQDRVNRKCVDTCTDNLIAAMDGQINICIKCTSPKPFKWISDRSCHQNCSAGFYPDIDKALCKQCHTSCLYCDGSYAQNCTSCKNDNPNKYLLLKMCVSSCPSGYYKNDTSGACQTCTDALYCASCYVGVNDGKIYCSTCKYGFYIQANHTCMEDCDPYMFKNKWNHSCDSCSPDCGDCASPSNSSCKNCRVGKYFLSNMTGGYCLSDCPSVYYVKSGFNCLACHKTCKTCNGVTSSNCLSCVEGFYLYSGYCRYVCPQKTYPNKQTLQCNSCDSKCKFCFGQTVDNCTSCETNLVLNNYTCTNSCPKSMIVNQWSVCQKFAQQLKICIFAIIMLLCMTVIY